MNINRLEFFSLEIKPRSKHCYEEIEILTLSCGVISRAPGLWDFSKCFFSGFLAPAVLICWFKIGSLAAFAEWIFLACFSFSV